MIFPIVTLPLAICGKDNDRRREVPHQMADRLGLAGEWRRRRRYGTGTFWLRGSKVGSRYCFNILLGKGVGGFFIVNLFGDRGFRVPQEEDGLSAGWKDCTSYWISSRKVVKRSRSYHLSVQLQRQWVLCGCTSHRLGAASSGPLVEQGEETLRSSRGG